MEELKINDEKYITLILNKEQYDYLLLVLTGLVDLEKKIPKIAKTKNSKTLIELYNKIHEIDVTVFE